MNIRMAAVAVCALTLGATPAKADLLPAGLFTIETTFTATPNVAQTGEAVLLDLTLTLIPDLAADAAANVIVFGTAFVFPDTLSITDGAGHTRSFALSLIAGIPSEYTFAVSYAPPGIYAPTFQGTGLISIERLPVGTEFIHHVDAEVRGATSVSVIPAPIAGAGLPGLVLAFGGVVTWWRQRKDVIRSGSSWYRSSAL